MTKMGQTSWSTRNENRLRAICDYYDIPLSIETKLTPGVTIKTRLFDKVQESFFPDPVSATLREHMSDRACRDIEKFKRTQGEPVDEDILKALAKFYGVVLKPTVTTDAHGNISRGYMFDFEGETYGNVAQCELHSHTFQNLCRMLQITVLLVVHGKDEEEWSSSEKDRMQQVLLDMSAHPMNGDQAEQSALEDK